MIHNDTPMIYTLNRHSELSSKIEPRQSMPLLPAGHDKEDCGYTRPQFYLCGKDPRMMADTCRKRPAILLTFQPNLLAGRSREHQRSPEMVSASIKYSAHRIKPTKAPGSISNSGHANMPLGAHISKLSVPRRTRSLPGCQYRPN